MAFALTKVRAYGIEVDEALNKRVRQYLHLTGTAANTDTAFDFGTYAGTFWTAVGGTQPGIDALKAIKDIQTRSEIFLDAQGTVLAGKSRQDSSRSGIVSLNSTASAGGGATETVALTGALTTDSILSVFQFVAGANSTALIGAGGATGVIGTNDQIALAWTANPGAGARVRVQLQRTVTTPDAGGYQLAMDGTNTRLPNLTFASGDAPTAWGIMLSWMLQDGVTPVECVKFA